MWWSRRRALASLAALAPLLAGCGFQPMYGRGAGRKMAATMTAIEITPIPDRIGQILRNDLIDSLTPRGQPARPIYRLAITLKKSSNALAIQPDATITRFNLRLDASFTLTDVATGKIVYKDRSRAIGSYNAVKSDFATLAAERDSERRAAQSLSEEITTLLGVFLARRKADAGSG